MVDSYYLYYLVINSKELIQSSSTKSLKGIVTKSSFSSIELPLPPIDIQRQFAKVAQKLENIRTLRTESTEYLNKLYGAVVTKCFKGVLA